MVTVRWVGGGTAAILHMGGICFSRCLFNSNMKASALAQVYARSTECHFRLLNKICHILHFFYSFIRCRRACVCVVVLLAETQTKSNDRLHTYLGFQTVQGSWRSHIVDWSFRVLPQRQQLPTWNHISGISVIK